MNTAYIHRSSHVVARLDGVGPAWLAHRCGRAKSNRKGLIYASYGWRAVEGQGANKTVISRVCVSDA